MTDSYLVSNVEMTAAGGRTGGAEVGYNGGGQHVAPAALDYHNAQDLALRLRDYHLQTRTTLILNRSCDFFHGLFVERKKCKDKRN